MTRVAKSQLQTLAWKLNMRAKPIIDSCELSFHVVGSQCLWLRLLQSVRVFKAWSAIVILPDGMRYESSHATSYARLTYSHCIAPLLLLIQQAIVLLIMRLQSLLYRPTRLQTVIVSRLIRVSVNRERHYRVLVTLLSAARRHRHPSVKNRLWIFDNCNLSPWN